MHGESSHLLDDRLGHLRFAGKEVFSTALDHICWQMNLSVMLASCTSLQRHPIIHAKDGAASFVDTTVARLDSRGQPIPQGGVITYICRGRRSSGGSSDLVAVEPCSAFDGGL